MKTIKFLPWGIVLCIYIISCTPGKTNEADKDLRENQLNEINAFIDTQWGFILNSSIEEAKATMK